MRDFERRLVTAVEGGVRYSFDRPVLDELSAVLASYLGHFRVAAATRLWAGICERFVFLGQYFSFDAECWRLRRHYDVPDGFRRVRDQYAWFRRRFPDDVLLFQVGRFCEFHAPGDAALAEGLGLRLLEGNARRVRFGFPVVKLDGVLLRLRSPGRSVLVITEQAGESLWVRRRAPAIRYVWRLCLTGPRDAPRQERSP